MHFNVGADTNVLFSGLYYGRMAEPFTRAIQFDTVDLYQSEYLRDELVTVCRRKRLPLEPLEKLYSFANVHVITDASYYSKIEFEAAEKLVRDAKDIPVFVFAKKMISLGKIDFFVSGDRDLLQEEVRRELNYKILDLREFNETLALNK